MFPQRPLQVSLLWTAVLFQHVLGTCERPAWATVGWDMTQQDLMQSPQEQPHSFHNSMCQMCHEFTGMGLSKGCQLVLYASCKVALYMAGFLGFLYLLFRRIKRRRKKMMQVPIFSSTTEITSEHTLDTEKMLFRLVANTSKMMKYLKQVAHQRKKEARYHKLRKKKKAEEMDDELLFSSCSHHSSCGDTFMHDI